MEVTVRFYATLRDVSATPQITINTNGETVGDIIDALVTKYGEEFRDEILNIDGSIQRNVRVLINGLNIDRIAPLQNKVREGDTIYIFPPIIAG